jgi:hypothetical protein
MRIRLDTGNCGLIRSQTIGVTLTESTSIERASKRSLSERQIPAHNAKHIGKKFPLK